MKARGLVLVCVLVATGCGPQYFLRTTVWEPAAVVILTNDNVTIRGRWNDAGTLREWELRSGQTLRREEGPVEFFFSQTLAAIRSNGFVDFHDGTAYLGCAFGGGGVELLSAYRIPSLPVTVEREVSGTVESYHGRLLLFPIVEGADEIAKRRWQVSIPDRYFASARGGGVSVVYGTYDAPDAARNVCGKISVQPISWVLWLSDIPLLRN